MKHGHEVKQYDGTAEQLAEDLGNLYYNALTKFLTLFAAKMARDAEADLGRGRPKLATELEACAGHLDAAAKHMQTAWAICAPQIPAAASDPDDMQ